MANPIAFNTGANKLEGTLSLAAMITAELNYYLVDQANLLNSGYFADAGSVNNTGSGVIRFRRVSLGGNDLFKDASSEYSDESAQNTDLTDSKVDITVSRKFLIRHISDLASMTQYGEQVNPITLALDMGASYLQKFNAMICTAASSATTIKGSTTAGFSLDTLFDGIYSLEASDSGAGNATPYLAVLHGIALGELQDSIRSESGNSLAYNPATAEMLKAKPSGFVGSILGTDIIKTKHVADDGTAYHNFITARNGIAYGHGAPNIVGAAEVMQLADAKCVVEFDRASEQALSKIVGHAYMGCAIVDQGRIAMLKSKV